MSDNGQKQHYISGFLIRQWAEYGKVGVVCMYHRDSAEVSATAQTLHSVVDLWSEDVEKSWNDTETDARAAIDCIKKSLGCGGDDYAAAEAALSESKHFDSLIELAVLHHARSLAVPVRRLYDRHNYSGSAEDIEDAIQVRRNEAQSYYNCGLAVNVLPANSPAALGAVPVLHTPSLGGPLPNDPSLFMMPLTPHLVIVGIPEMDRGRVIVREDNIDGNHRLTWQLMAEPGLFATPYLICKPSDLEQTAETALAITEGNPLHWIALYDRMALYRDVVSVEDFEERRAAWRPLALDQRNRQGWLNDPVTSNSMRLKHRIALATNAHAIQEELDQLGISVCDCKGNRDTEADPELAELWEYTMPHVVCQHIRQKRNAESGASTPDVSS